MILQMELWGKTVSEFGISVFLLFIILIGGAVVGRLIIKALSAYLLEQKKDKEEQQKREDENNAYMRSLVMKLMETVNKNADAFNLVANAINDQTAVMRKQNEIYKSWVR